MFNKSVLLADWFYTNTDRVRGLNSLLKDRNVQHISYFTWICPTSSGDIQQLHAKCSDVITDVRCALTECILVNLHTYCILVEFWGIIWNIGVLTVQETADLLLSVYSCKQEQDNVIQQNLHDSLRRRLMTKSRACCFYLCVPGRQHIRCGDNLCCSSQDETRRF